MRDKIVIEYEVEKLTAAGKKRVLEQQEWVKSPLYCLGCGEKELWRLLDSAHDCEGDSGDLHICLECLVSFYANEPTDLSAESPDVMRLTEALRNA